MIDPVVILVPVLRRPWRVQPLLDSVETATPEPHRTLFIVNDDDEHELDALRAADAEMLVVPPAQRSYACKINAGYHDTTEPLIFLAADDLHFRPDWYPRAQALLSDTVHVVGTNDICNPRVMTGAHSTHSLLRRTYIQERSGVVDQPDTVLYPGYPHEFCDDEFIQTAMTRGVYAHAFDSIVEHLHPMVGKAEDDDTYRLGRAHSRESRRLFQQRSHLWKNEHLHRQRATVVTASFGGVDAVLHPQATQDITVDWVCFTDNPNLTVPAPWRTVVEPARFEHPCLAAKVHKMTPTVHTTDVVWIDASHEITSGSFVREALDARHDGVAAFKHPRRDCAPGDQLVRTTNRGDVRIDELVPDLDRLVAWRPPVKGVHPGISSGGRGRPGYGWRRSVRSFTGDLLVMLTNETRVRVTPNHWVAARWVPRAATASAVYLMRRGDWWRVGKARLLDRTFGPGGRARGEGADGVWLLGVYETSAEALLAENFYSASYGLTQAGFRNPTGGVRHPTVSDIMLKDLHERLAAGGSGERARRLLNDLGLDVQHPIWPNDGIGAVRSFRLRASNVVGGWMEVPVADVSDEVPRWLPVSIAREPVVAMPVYSLDVDHHHTYIGDGQALYNCIYDEADASLGAEGQGGKYDSQPLLEQVAHYRADGHPDHWGLWACGVVAWDLANPQAVELGRQWLAENERWSWQDQLSFPVAARRLGLTPGVFPVRQIERNGRGFLANRWLRIWAHVTPPEPPTPLPPLDCGVSVLIPFTSDDEHRQAARSYVLGWYARHFPEWEIVEGHADGEWSKGAALAAAAQRASHDLFMVADADSIVEPPVVLEAVQTVAAGAAWAVPHRKVYRLSQTHTERVYAGTDPSIRNLARPAYTGVAGGGITVLTRDAWNIVGGIDPRFVGWGGEDLAFGWALETLTGPCVRLQGRLFHLWHEQEPVGRKRRGCLESEALAGRYRDARGNPDAMRQLITEHQLTTV